MRCYNLIMFCIFLLPVDFSRSVYLGILLRLNRTSTRFSRWGHHMSALSAQQGGNRKALHGRHMRLWGKQNGLTLI